MLINRTVADVCVRLRRGTIAVATRPLASRDLEAYPVILVNPKTGEVISWFGPYRFHEADSIKRAFNDQYGGKPWH